jgi:hypothetical protein
MDRKVTVALSGLVLALATATPGLAQGRAEPSVTGAPAGAGGQQFEITKPPPAARDASRPRDSDFYREDVRVRHEPVFIEPATGTIGGRKVGLSGWTAPPGQGDRTVQREVGGWFSLGITFIWDAPPLPGAPAMSAR